MGNRLAKILCLSCAAALAANVGFGADSEIRLEWLNNRAKPLTGDRHGLSFYNPAHPEAVAAEDTARFRLRVTGTPVRPSTRISLVSVDPSTGRIRDRLEIRSLTRDNQGRLTTPWLVLVADADDRSAPQLADRALRARLGDRIEARVRVGGARATTREISAGKIAAAPGLTPPDVTPLKRLYVDVRVLRAFPEGAPLTGGDEAGARAVMRHQVDVLGEILTQCDIEVVMRTAEQLVVVDPPGPCLLAVGERFGFPSGGGEVRLVVDGKRLGPWKVGEGYTPLETARLLARHLVRAGFRPDLTENAKRPSFASATADIVVRREDGGLAEVTSWPDEAISTDSRQSLDIGSVTLADGIDSYDDNNAVAGTIEERTLVKALVDPRDRTVNIFVVNRFSSKKKQGESFIRASGSSVRNTVLVDANALVRARQSYALSHEVGHVLLDDLGHPDARGDAPTWLLMHSNSSSAVDGPKRLTSEECERIHRVSGELLD